MRSRPIKCKDCYRWNGLMIKRQDNKLWGIWFNYRDKMMSDLKTLSQCMKEIDLYFLRKSKKHLRLVSKELQ